MKRSRTVALAIAVAVPMIGLACGTRLSLVEPPPSDDEGGSARIDALAPRDDAVPADPAAGDEGGSSSAGTFTTRQCVTITTTTPGATIHVTVEGASDITQATYTFPAP